MTRLVLVATVAGIVALAYFLRWMLPHDEARLPTDALDGDPDFVG